MNIYIYGSQSFKKEIHSTLNQGSIKLKLDSNTVIKDIASLNELKEAIQENPDDIYLIDDEKIIKKDSKLKLFKPKDGIEEKFLLDNGIADISLDSFSEIPKYILKRQEELKGLDEDIQNSIIDIIDKAYEKDNKQLDNELSNLLSKEEKQSDKDDLLDGFEVDMNLDDFDFNENKKDGNIEDLMDFNFDENENTKSPAKDGNLEDLMDFGKDIGLNNISFDYDDEDILTKKNDSSMDFDEIDDPFSEINDFNSLEDEEILDNKNKPKENLSNDFGKIEALLGEMDDFNLPEEMDFKEEKKINNLSKGEIMNDDFSELDLLNEQDIMDALNGLDTPSSPVSSPKSVATPVNKTQESISISSSNTNELSELIAKLLQNKTLEITIKIKD